MTAGGPNHASDTLGTYLYSTSFGAMGSSNPQLGYATAIAIVILALSAILSVIQIRIGKRLEIETMSAGAGADPRLPGTRRPRWRWTSAAAGS